MRAWFAVCLLLWLVACAGMSEKPLTADEMPVAFSPQEVAGSEPKYDRLYDDSSGADFRRMVVSSQRGSAVMVYQSVPGDYVFSGSGLQQALRRMIKDDIEITWGDSGSTGRGAVDTQWQAFELGSEGMGCMGLRRELKHHAEIGNFPNTAQAVAWGYLCRRGAAMGEDDAVRLAAVLQTKA